MICVALFWTLFSLKGPCPSCAEGLQRWMQYSRSHQTRITSLDLLARLLMQSWLSKFQVDTAVSSPIFHSPLPLTLRARGYSQPIHPPVLYSHQGLSQPTGNTPRTLDLALPNLVEVPAGPLTCPSKVPTVRLRPVLPGNMLGVQLPTAYVIMKVLNSMIPWGTPLTTVSTWPLNHGP